MKGSNGAMLFLFALFTKASAYSSRINSEGNIPAAHAYDHLGFFQYSDSPEHYHDASHSESKEFLHSYNKRDHALDDSIDFLYNLLRIIQRHERVDLDLERKIEKSSRLRSGLRARCNRKNECVQKPACEEKCQSTHDELEPCPKKLEKKPRCGRTMPPSAWHKIEYDDGKK